MYEKLLRRLLSLSRGFMTFHRRPRAAADFGRVSHAPLAAKVAIVMQGAVMAEDNFTLETVRVYKKLFPDALIIVSTWEDTGTQTLASLRASGAHVVASPKPPHAGISNVNFQIASTVQGMHKAQEQGAQFVLKTRTDQRLYAPDTLAYLCGLLVAFPLTKKTSQQARLIATGLNTFKYRPYSISDMFLFGTTQDMVRYWGVPLDERPAIPYEPKTLNEYARMETCEVYFVTHFMRSLEHTPTFTLADSWSVYRDYFCVIDPQNVDLYWPKYDRLKEYRRLKYDSNYTDEELSFRDWLLLYSNKSGPAPEPVLQKPFGAKVE